MHFIYFSDSWVTQFRDLTFNERGVPLAFAGITGTIFVVVLLGLAKRYQIITNHHFWFVVWVGFFPFFILSYLTQKLNYNFILYNPRHASSFYLIVEMVIIAVIYKLLTSIIKNWKNHTVLIVLTLVLIFPPNLFHVARFIQNKVIYPINHNYVTTQNYLYVPILSSEKLQSTVQRITNLVKNPKDVIVLALDQNTTFEAWIEMENYRTMPLLRADESFVHTHGTSGLDIYSADPIYTSESLRVIMAVSQRIVNDEEWFERLKSRFSQAESWTQLEDPTLEKEGVISVYYTDLAVQTRSDE